MAINLSKGQRVGVAGQQKRIGLGWDPNASSGQDFDLDGSVFMLGGNGKLPSADFFVFYNNPKSPDGAVVGSADDRSGAGSDGDDETLTLDFSKLDPRIEQLVVAVTIHEAEARKQNFGQVRNSFIRICDAASGTEEYKYELEEDFSLETAVEFGRFYKRNGEWKFEAVGRGFKGGLQALVAQYG